jgi:hypothetical protein
MLIRCKSTLVPILTLNLNPIWFFPYLGLTEPNSIQVSQSNTWIPSHPLTRHSFSLFWLNSDKLPNPISFSLWLTPHRVWSSSPRGYTLVSVLCSRWLTQAKYALLSLSVCYPNGHPSQARSFFFLISTSPCISLSNVPTPPPLNR